MRTLTKEERHEVYKDVLNRLKECQKSGDAPYLCHLSCNSLRDLHEIRGLISFDALDLLPELSNKKPGGDYVWWYREDFDSRFKCINKCIEETKP